MEKLTELYLQAFNKPLFQLAQGVLIGMVIAFGIWLLCKGIDKDMQKEEEELMQVQEAKPYGGFVAWSMEIAPKQVAYAAVAEQLINCGVLKVQIEDRPMGTVCNWAIKAVKWE